MFPITLKIQVSLPAEHMSWTISDWCCSLHLHIDFLATISKTLARLSSYILVKPPQCSLYSVHPSIFNWNNKAFNAFWHLCGSKNTVWFVSWMVCLVNACLCATATFCSSVLFSSGFQFYWLCLLSLAAIRNYYMFYSFEALISGILLLPRFLAGLILLFWRDFVKKQVSLL